LRNHASVHWTFLFSSCGIGILRFLERSPQSFYCISIQGISAIACNVII
jgi:hypothetical protein